MVYIKAKKDRTITTDLHNEDVSKCTQDMEKLYDACTIPVAYHHYNYDYFNSGTSSDN